MEGAAQQHLLMWCCDDGEVHDRALRHRIGEQRIPSASRPAQGLYDLEANGFRSSHTA